VVTAIRSTKPVFGCMMRQKIIIILHPALGITGNYRIDYYRDPVDITKEPSKIITPGKYLREFKGTPAT
jgi:hypothetical protein